MMLSVDCRKFHPAFEAILLQLKRYKSGRFGSNTCAVYFVLKLIRLSYGLKHIVPLVLLLHIPSPKYEPN